MQNKDGYGDVVAIMVAGLLVCVVMLAGFADHSRRRVTALEAKLAGYDEFRTDTTNITMQAAIALYKHDEVLGDHVARWTDLDLHFERMREQAKAKAAAGKE